MKAKTIASGVIAAVLLATAAHAEAPVCALAEGTPSATLEALNTLVLAAKFSDVTVELAKRMHGLPADALAQLGAAYAAPFTGCTTLAQRRDAAGLLQEVVIFEGEHPLFVYWVEGPMGGETGPLSFSMNSNFDEIMAMLR